MWPSAKKKKRINKSPRLSVVVIAYDMQREMLRTLLTLGRRYQQNTDTLDYEVIVVDNGSPEPLSLRGVNDIGVSVQHCYLKNASVSPAAAINYGVSQSNADYVCIMIDGARMVSPGLIRGIFDTIPLVDEPVIVIPGLHLGPEHQGKSVNKGYNKEVEDKLLESVNWKEDGYRLFQIASWGGSCQQGWFAPMAESNCITLRRKFFWKLGGYEESFSLPGGGLVNLDFYKRSVEYEASSLIQLLGEGCFHQLHGGVTTGSETGLSFQELEREYIDLRGQRFEKPLKPAVLFGSVPSAAWPALYRLTETIMASGEYQSVERYCSPYIQGTN